MNKKFISPLLLGMNVLIFGLLICISWKRWTELKIDTYQTFMISDLIFSGEGILYKDYQYFFGPMAPYLNAFILRIFGNYYETFCGIGFVSAVVTILLLYRLIKSQVDAFAGHMGVFLFLTLCLCSNPWGYAAHNYFTPYCYSSTFSVIGLLLTLEALLAIEADDSHYRDWFFGGLFILLNRVELGIMVLTLVILPLMLGRGPKKDMKKVLLWLLPSFGVFVFFAIVTGPRKLILDNLFWPPHLPFNTYSTYTASVLGKGFFQMKDYLISYLCYICPFLFLFVTRDRSSSLLLFFITMMLALFILDWSTMLLSWPFAIATLLLFRRKQIHWRYRVGIIFILILSMRILLNFLIGGYFFYLGVSFIGMTIIILFKLIPNITKLREKEVILYKIVITTFLIGLGIKACWRSFPFHLKKDMYASFSAGSLYLDPLDIKLASTIKWLEANTPKSSSVHVIPEGAGLTYFSGRRWVNPHAHSLATDFNFYGRDYLIGQLDLLKPDYIVVIDDYRPFYGPGNTSFGVDYGKELIQWIRDHYKEVEKFGKKFQQERHRGESILIFQRLR